jgi:hypothetical protein
MTILGTLLGRFRTPDGNELVVEAQRRASDSNVAYDLYFRWASPPSRDDLEYYAHQLHERVGEALAQHLIWNVPDPSPSHPPIPVPGEWLEGRDCPS